MTEGAATSVIKEDFVLPIGGVHVKFPFKPYPSQKAMMAMIIKGLNKSQNCLIESPTGSGKSLALLCSTLGWLQSEEDRVQRFNNLIDQGISDPDILGVIYGNASSIRGEIQDLVSDERTTTPAINISNNAPSDTVQTPQNGANASGTHLQGGFIRDDDDNDFKETTMQMRLRDEGGDVSVLNESEISSSVQPPSLVPSPPPRPPSPPTPTVLPKKRRVPIIYFGTRTHKQIYQITKELRRCGYKNTRSAVLGSREHSCIHPLVSTNNNKNEECKKLMDQRKSGLGGCLHFDGVSRMREHDQLESMGVKPGWDIEDLVKLGKKLKSCPYYATRFLKDTARIIICPYNYLVDPLIRETMQINLKDNVVILDEAHNVEDCSREAASLSVNIDDLVDARNDLEKLANKEVHVQSCRPLIEMLSNLCMWMHSFSEKLTDYSDFGRSGKIIAGVEMIKQLKSMDISPQTLEYLQESLGTLIEDPQNEDQKPAVPKPTSASSQLIKGLHLMFYYLFKENQKYAQDYEIALVRSQNFGRSDRKRRSSHAYTLNFWCLNPGVTFSSLGEKSRCVILTSGTLSPMESFESELQVHFPIRLEANHVIAKEQVWVGTIRNGPTKHPLIATYKHSETWAFQDELGRMLVDVCDAVPRGVLCFFSSYSMLEKLLDRWKGSSIYEQISEKKVIISEPRRSNEFEEAMKQFYGTIQNTKNAGANEVNGALFMAVCRGKVSEGLDFTDDNARAVITVGIPFPNVKDIQVDLKRKYNNKFSNQRGLLNGTQWYEIQAYRALNQALGRCIRHRYDWGALILVDERFQQTSYGGSSGDRYIKGLSKWVKKSLVHRPDFQDAIRDIRKFATNMTENPPQEETNKLNVSEISNISMADTQSHVNSEGKFATSTQNNEVLRPEVNFVTSTQIDANSTAEKRNKNLFGKTSSQVPLTPISNFFSPKSKSTPVGSKTGTKRKIDEIQLPFRTLDAALE